MPRRHGGGCSNTQYPRCRGVGNSRRPIPQLTLGVISPALDRTISEKRTGMMRPCREGGGCNTRYPRCRGAGNSRRPPIPQLTIVVVPPALDCAISEKHTGMIRPYREGGGCSNTRHHRCRGAGNSRRPPIPQLTLAVIPPAVDRAIGEKRTGMVIPRRHGQRRCGRREV
jgi:hypothetical protein